MKPGDRQGANPAHEAKISRDLASAGYDGVFACKQGGYAPFGPRAFLREREREREKERERERICAVEHWINDFCMGAISC